MQSISLPMGVVLVLGVAMLALVAVTAALWLRLGRHRQDVETLRQTCAALSAGQPAPVSAAPSGAVAGVLATITAIAATRDEASHSIQRSRQFLAAASHDLRQPLQALGLFVATLSQYPLGAAERKVVDKIESALEALEHLLDTLLDISRLDAGAVRAHQAIFPPQELFERLALEFVPMAEAKDLALRIVSTSTLIGSDPELLERILRNLLANAVRYTAKGGVVLGARRRGREIAIEVWDSGQGIPKDKLGEIFREFSQLQGGTRDRHHGLGLGLAIVERLAALLGHRIEVASVAGRGSVFRILVPRLDDDCEEDEEDGADLEIARKSLVADEKWTP